ncbi:sensor histidine kinase [Desulfurobacterium sp.]
MSRVLKKNSEKIAFWKDFFLYYKVSRFIFSSSLFLILISLSLLREGIIIYNVYSLGVIFLYSTVSLLSLFYRRENPYDFLLDIMFISALIKSNILYWDYIAILYLFPIFFSAFFLESPITELFPVISLVIYGITLYTTKMYTLQDLTIKLFLNGVAFFAIYIAGKTFAKKMTNQMRYIAELEEEKKKNEVFKRLYRISADLAHEIKNPLASIKAAVDLMFETEQANKNLLELLKRETERLSSVINDFLMLSRPLDVHQTEVDIKELIKQVVEAVRYVYPEKNCKLILPESKITIKIPYKSFYSAISNVIKNAFEWSKKTVIISVSYEKGLLKICIEDDGPGIKDEEKEKIFEPFFTKKKEGTGLGLAIAKRVAIELGGRLTVTSSIHGGCVFCFEIPVEGENESTYNR